MVNNLLQKITKQQCNFFLAVFTWTPTCWTKKCNIGLLLLTFCWWQPLTNLWWVWFQFRRNQNWFRSSTDYPCHLQLEVSALGKLLSKPPSSNPSKLVSKMFILRRAMFSKARSGFMRKSDSSWPDVTSPVTDFRFMFHICFMEFWLGNICINLNDSQNKMLDSYVNSLIFILSFDKENICWPDIRCKQLSYHGQI